MTWIDIDVNPPDRVLRQFAVTWVVVMGAFGVNEWWLHDNHQGALVLAVLAIVVGGPGLILPATVRWLFVALTVAAFPLGWIVSQAMLAILFVLVITPMALFFKLQGRDRLSRMRSTGQESYWKTKSTPQDVRRYFRQY